MKLNDFLAAMEQIAPKELALDFDNPGLLVEPDHDEIKRVLVALDCTPAVAKEAIEMQADLILAHHPLFFYPVKSMRYSDPETAAACMLLRNGIGMFAAHTNLDAALGGVNDTLCDLFEIDKTEPIDEGVGRVGMLKRPVPMSAFLQEIETKLNATVRFAGDSNALVKRVAVLGGSGASAIREAAEQKADVLLTGEVKHSDAIDARTLGLNLAVAGHFETECVVLEPLIRRLQNECFDVQYKLSRVDASPFARLEEGTP